jgi:CRISP-associated protein Cas1
MRDDHSASSFSFPAPTVSAYRICPVCERGFSAPKVQRCCSTRCAADWRRKKRPDRRPRRFDVIGERLSPASITDATEDASEASWAERGSYWESVLESGQHRKATSSLGVAGHGALLRVEGNTLIIRHGFTHYPQQRREQRYRPRDRALPQRIVLLNCDGAVSVPALSWLAKQRVSLMLLDWSGNLTAAFSGEPTARDARLCDRLYRLESSQVVALARPLIEKKLRGQAVTVATFPGSVSRDKTMQLIQRERESLAAASTVEEIRITEARAAAAYFRLWTGLPMRWVGLGRKPVPFEWFNVGMRGSTVGYSNRKASHPAHAMLNYVYGVLQNRVAVEVAKVGLDPGAGVLHSRQLGRPSLVLDLMEPLRPVVDLMLVGFLTSHRFARADFPIGDDGVVRLHPQLARAVSELEPSYERIVDSVAVFVRALSP